MNRLCLAGGKALEKFDLLILESSYLVSELVQPYIYTHSRDYRNLLPTSIINH